MRLKHKTFNKVVTKALFMGEAKIVLPKDTIAVRRKVEINLEVEDARIRAVLPIDNVEEVLSKTDDVFIMDFCLCRTSSKCKDRLVDKECIFLGNGVHKYQKIRTHRYT